jgi:hypothetical protein
MALVLASFEVLRIVFDALNVLSFLGLFLVNGLATVAPLCRSPAHASWVY